MPKDARLNGVSATSASDAWAVGSHTILTAGPEPTMILHWDGKAWTVAAVG
jgi:hypothetical protein